MPKRLANGRAEELLDGVMRIVAARGFSELKMSDLARELHCSVATLYKLAPSKTDLVILALAAVGRAPARRYRCPGACNAPRRPLGLGPTTAKEPTACASCLPLFAATSSILKRPGGPIERSCPIGSSSASRRCSTRPREAGEIRPINVRFAVGMFRYIAFAVRDEDLLAAAGLTAREAMLEVDKMIWDGVLCHPAELEGGASPRRRRSRPDPVTERARPDSGARPSCHALRTRPSAGARAWRSQAERTCTLPQQPHAIAASHTDPAHGAGGFGPRPTPPTGPGGLIPTADTAHWSRRVRSATDAADRSGGIRSSTWCHDAASCGKVWIGSR